MPCEGFVMKKLQLTSQTLQQGAALIAVLIVLLIVTVLGITAMRMGLSSLALANNSQMSQLLFQTADMGTAQLRTTIEQNILAAMDVNGVIGNASGGDTNLCLRPTAGTDFTNMNAGACNPNDNTDYMSTRAVILTQMTYSRRTVTDGESSRDVVDISDTGSSVSATGAPEKLKTFSTSVAPSFGSASKDTIKECLAYPADDEETDNAAVYTITDCLVKVGAVFATHVTEYRIKRN